RSYADLHRPFHEDGHPLLKLIRGEIHKEQQQTDDTRATQQHRDDDPQELTHCAFCRSLMYWSSNLPHSGLLQTSLIDPLSGSSDCRVSQVTTSPQNLQCNSPRSNGPASPSASRTARKSSSCTARTDDVIVTLSYGGAGTGL